MAFIAGGTNRSLSSKPPSDYLKEVLEEHGKQALEAHCIPTDPALWQIAEFPMFLEYRRAALARAINDFIDINRTAEPGPDAVAIIEKGEGETIEFKSSLRWDYRAGALNKALESVIVKSVGGLLNAKGGTLLIGVDDKGVAIGLKKDYGTLSSRPNRDGYEQTLVNLFSS
jgi:hypothetical protein